MTTADAYAAELGRIASQLRHAGDLPRAEVAMLAALDVRSVSPRVQARLLRRLAVILRARERYDDALDALRSSRSYYQATGDRISSACVDVEASGIEFCAAAFDRARRSARAGLDVAGIPPAHYSAGLQNLTLALAWSARTQSHREELRCCLAACAAPDGVGVNSHPIIGPYAVHWRACVAGWRLSRSRRHLDRLAMVRDGLDADGHHTHAACAALELAVLLAEAGADWADVRHAAAYAWRGLRRSPCTTRAYAALTMVHESIARQRIDVSAVWLAMSRLRRAATAPP